MKWTIRIKFMLVTCGLLIACLGVYLVSAMTVFKSDKTQLVFDLNRSQVANLTGEIESFLGSAADKLKVYSQLPQALVADSVADLFSENSDIVMAGVYSPRRSELIRSFVQEKYFATYGLDPLRYQQQFQQLPVEEILAKGTKVWNGSLQDGVPLMAFGRRVLLQDSKGQVVDQYVVVGFLRLDRFLKAVQMVNLSQIRVVNAAGDTLIDSTPKNILDHLNLSTDPTFLEALKSGVRVGLQKQNLPDGPYLTAYSRGFDNQFFVLSKTAEDQVFAVVKTFAVRTFLFGIIVLTAVILAAFLLSRSLTKNIEKLADRMEGASKGDLTTPIAMKSYDETSLLADTFNKMIQDLRQSRAELEAMNRELDQKVIERTAQVEEQAKKIREIQETLIKTTRLASVGEVAGRAAHEVLNPLTILLTRLGLMQKRMHRSQQEPLALLNEIQSAWQSDFKKLGMEGLVASWKTPSKVSPQLSLLEEDLQNLVSISQDLEKQSQITADDVNFLKNEAERISKIVNSMRRMGNLSSDAEEHSIQGILEDCGKIMADLFAERGFALKFQFNAPVDQAIVDRDEMVQAFTNLIRNSLQSLEMAQKHQPGQYGVKVITAIEGSDLVVKIEDNGVGIALENQNQIFSGGFTTKSRENGTGLGLGISRRFVRNYGGDITLGESKPYLATVFVIRLPLAQVHQRVTA